MSGNNVRGISFLHLTSTPPQIDPIENLNIHLGYLDTSIREKHGCELPTIPDEEIKPEVAQALQFINAYLKAKISPDAYELALIYLYTNTLPKGSKHAFNNFVAVSTANYLTAEIVTTLAVSGKGKDFIPYSNAQLLAIQGLIENLGIVKEEQLTNEAYNNRVKEAGYEYLLIVMGSLEFGIVNVQSALGKNNTYDDSTEPYPLVPVESGLEITVDPED